MCEKKGHIKPACSSKLSQGVKLLKEQSEFSDSDDELLPMHLQTLGMIYSNQIAPLVVTVDIEGRPLGMEVDTGAAVSVISKSDLHQLIGEFPIKPTGVVLSTYTNERITPMGICTVNVRYEKQAAKLELFVLDSINTPPLLHWGGYAPRENVRRAK